MIIHYPLNNGSKSNIPKLIVIHAMGEYIEGEPDLWAPAFLEKLGLSAHALVTPDGNIIKCREDDEGAWHARGYNKNSLGIEFLVEGIHTYGSFMTTIREPYITDAQFDVGQKQVREWLARHNIKKIKAHSELSPGRKFDPGRGFPMDVFLQEL